MPSRRIFTLSIRVVPSILVLGILLLTPAQPASATEGKKDSSGVNIPRRAMLRSMILPGWGQFYNKKQIKGSLLAAAEVGSAVGYFVRRNQLRDLGSSERNVYFFSTIGIVLYSMADAYVDAYLDGVDWAEVEIGIGNEGEVRFQLKFNFKSAIQKAKGK